MLVSIDGVSDVGLRTSLHLFLQIPRPGCRCEGLVGQHGQDCHWKGQMSRVLRTSSYLRPFSAQVQYEDFVDWLGQGSSE